jgi:hypothetical protein
MELDLGELRLRTLTTEDAALLVEATRAESAPALWGPRPAGPYSLEDARSALRAWDPHRHRQVSVGVLQGARLVAALGLILDGPHSAELAYWVRPEQRRRGIALRSVQARRPGRTPPRALPGCGWRSTPTTRHRCRLCATGRLPPGTTPAPPLPCLEQRRPRPRHLARLPHLGPHHLTGLPKATRHRAIPRPSTIVTCWGAAALDVPPGRHRCS